MVVLFFPHLLSALPQPVLAAVVLVAVAGLFKLSTLKHLWRGDRPEFVVAMAALARRARASGLLRGVMIGAIISLVQLLRRASRPHVAFLGRIPGTRRFSDRERHPDNELIPGVLIFRPESGSDLFQRGSCVRHDPRPCARRTHAAQAGRARSVRRAARGSAKRPHAGRPRRRTHGGGIRFQAVEARSSVRDRLRDVGVDSKLGGINRFTTVADVLDNFRA